VNKDSILPFVCGAYAVVLVGLGIYFARQSLDRRFQQLGWQIADMQRRVTPQPIPQPTMGEQS
jgi:hypothetical protein